MANSRKTEENGIKNFNDIVRSVYGPQRDKGGARRKIQYFKRKGDQQFTKDGRGAETTIDLVLQACAKMSDNKCNGPEDAVVSEMIKPLPQEKIHIIIKCFQERFMGEMEAPRSWNIVKLVVFVETDAEPIKGIKSYRAIVLTLVMSK